MPSVWMLMVLLAGCSGSGGPVPVPLPPAGKVEPVQELLFARAGGGRLEFALTKVPKAYAIRVTQSDMTATDTRFELKTSLFQLGDRQVLDDVFAGKKDLFPAPASQRDSSELPTGTWANVRVKQADGLRDVTNPAVIAAMKSIEIEVRSQLKLIQSATPKVPQP